MSSFNNSFIISRKKENLNISQLGEEQKVPLSLEEGETKSLNENKTIKKVNSIVLGQSIKNTSNILNISNKEKNEIKIPPIIAKHSSKPSIAIITPPLAKIEITCPVCCLN